MKLELEKKLWEEQAIVCGIDEVGRGPLAGPVVAAAVIFPMNFVQTETLRYINDSKTLSKEKREELAKYIKREALAIGIGEVSEERIDEINILQATFEAMTMAVMNLTITPTMMLIDGNRFKSSLSIPYQTIVQGDKKIFSIAAASIVAKVYRDGLMKEYAKQYPEYGFETNMGYGTALHRKAIKDHGIVPLHRKTFLKNIV